MVFKLVNGWASPLIFGSAGFVAAMAALPQKAAAQSHDPARPNILVVTTEDISCYLGCYGDPNAKTPNLDRFATQAIRYTNMHTPNGVSAPSRFALITGCYPSRFGANYMRASDNHYEVCLPGEIRAYTEYLRGAGYFCTNNSKTDYQIGVTTAQWDENSTQATWKDCPEGQPFLSIFNIMTTHESMIWVRKDPLEVQPEDIDMSRFPYLPDDPVVRADLARLYTNIAIMDRESQAYFDEIEAAGLADNTIIIWYSDNGGPIPRGKRSIYDTGTRVPFMVKFPDGYRAGQVEDRIVTFMDIPATILSLAGVPVPDYMDGKAFLGEQTAAPARYFFQTRDRYGNSSDHSAGVQDQRFQYIRNYRTEDPNYMDNNYRKAMPMMLRMLEMRDAGELNEDQMQYFKAPRPVEEFYDLANDPYELHNLAGDPAFKYDFARLKAEYDAWNEGANARWDRWTEADWIEVFNPAGAQRVVAAPFVEKTAQGYVASCATPDVSLVWQVTDKKPAAEEAAPAGPGALMGGRTDRSKGWHYYTGPIPAVKGKYLTVKACRAGFSESAPVSLRMTGK